jgi:hypothetical protein
VCIYGVCIACLGAYLGTNDVAHVFSAYTLKIERSQVDIPPEKMMVMMIMMMKYMIMWFFMCCTLG